MKGEGIMTVDSVVVARPVGGMMVGEVQNGGYNVDNYGEGARKFSFKYIKYYSLDYNRSLYCFWNNIRNYYW